MKSHRPTTWAYGCPRFLPKPEPGGLALSIGGEGAKASSSDLDSCPPGHCRGWHRGSGAEPTHDTLPLCAPGVWASTMSLMILAAGAICMASPWPLNINVCYFLGFIQCIKWGGSASPIMLCGLKWAMGHPGGSVGPVAWSFPTLPLE